MIFSELRELNEMSTVSRCDGMCIAVNPDRNRTGDEYFKLYNAFSEAKADKMIRILFKRPEYVFHRNKKHSDWILSASEKRELVKFLNKKVSLTDAADVSHRITVFQKAIVLFNYERGLGYNSDETFSLMLEADQKGYLPLNLEMPDYTELEQL